MDTVIPLDLQRMFLGEDPPLFLLEILLRIAIIWPWTMLLLRWIGGRSISQLSLVEFLLVIALGSAVGDSLFYPEVPLLHAMLVILVIIVIDKLIDQAIRQVQGAKRIFDGRPVEVMRDGVLCASMAGARQIGSLELMELLRLKGVRNLGSVHRAFLEPSGQLSIFAADPPLTGLPIMPPIETLDESHPKDGKRCCRNCGQLDPTAEDCPNCMARKWDNLAVRAPALK